MRIFQKMIEALGADFDFDPEIVDLLVKSANHINRFVSEIAYFVIKSIYEIPLTEQNEKIFIDLTESLIPITADGLANNWSQVRYAAS